MSKTQNLRNWLVDLRIARQAAFDEGDWEYVSFLQLRIDDVEDQISNATL